MLGREWLVHGRDRAVAGREDDGRPVYVSDIDVMDLDESCSVSCEERSLNVTHDHVSASSQDAKREDGVQKEACISGAYRLHYTARYVPPSVKILPSLDT